MEKWLRTAEILSKTLGLTPYESRAFVSLVIYGPMSPTKLAQKARIPRPRAYDVLKSLVEKGLLMERLGRPSYYAPVEPTQGLRNFLNSRKIEMLRLFEEERRTAQNVAELLSQMYEKSKEPKLESKVWFTPRNNVFVATYSEAIKNCENEFVVAATDLFVPEKEILRALELALQRGISTRTVRLLTEHPRQEELERYEEVIKLTNQVRYLIVKEIPLRFAIFDERDVILWFLSESEPSMLQTVEALWLRIPPLAKILGRHFEDLWRNSKPILPILEKIKKGSK